MNLIKKNKYLRRYLYTVLKNHYTSRTFREINKKLYFNAGKNFNSCFKTSAIIEPKITINLKNIIKDGYTIYDVGSNIGYFTILFSVFAHKGKVVAAEPDGDNLETLYLNIERNELKNVVVEEKAISSRIGKSIFYQDKNTGRTSSIEKNAWHPNAVEIIEDYIETTTLDDLSFNYGYPALIKCDVEGHELSVLEGGEKTLSYCMYILIEVVKKNRERIKNILEKYNYSIYNAESFELEKDKPLREINVSNILCINHNITK